MGFFSSTKTYVSASTVNLVTDLPSSLQSAIINSVLLDKNMVDEIQSTILSSVSNNISNIMTYAENSYYYGVSSFNLRITDFVETSVVQDVLRTEKEDDTIVVTYATSIKGSILTAALERLVLDYGYDIDTGIMSKPFAEPTRYGRYVNAGLDGFDSYKEVYELYPVSELYISDLIAIDDNTIKIVGIYTTEDVGYYEKTIVESFSVTVTTDIAISSIVLDAPYYFVRYTKTLSDATTVEDVWLYNTNLNTYPQLITHQSTEKVNPFLPIIPLRRNNEDLTKDSLQDGDAYVTSKKLLDMLGLDIDALTDGLEESESSDDIDHAYVTFAMTLDSIIDSDRRLPGSVKYLIDFLVYADELLATYTPAVDTGHSTSFGSNAHARITPAHNTIAIDSGGYKFEITYTEAEHSFKEGVIGEIGSTSVLTSVGGKVSAVPDSTTISDLNVFELSAWIDENSTYLQPSITLQYQQSDTIYEELTIYNLEHTMWVSGRKIVTNLEDIILGDDANFVLPLSIDHLKNISFQEREAILYYSFKMVVQSYKEVDTGFFGSIFFKMIMMIITVVLTIITLPAGGAGGWASAAAMGAMAAVMYIIELVLPRYLMALLLKEIAKLIIKAIGGDLALALAAILMVVAMAMGDTSSALTMMPSAVDMVSMAGQAFISGIEEVSKDAILAIEADTSSFTSESEERLDSFSAVQDELSMSDSVLDPFSLLENVGTVSGDSMLYGSSQVTIIYESPSEFIDRTIHPGNIGVLSLDIIENYVEIALQPDNQIA